MDGILLIDKPSGWTSFDVVARVRSLIRKSNSRIVELSDNQGKSYKTIGQADHKTPLRKVKVGHTGTLDPLATGLMIVVVGKYTKRAEEFSKLDKVYEVTMRLGQTSTTADEEGQKLAISDKRPEIGDIQAAFKQFTGDIMQVPPIYSAMKVNGQRAYKLARAGKEVKLEPRNVKVYSIQLTDYSYPEVRFTAKVSSGTYIRSLVVDMGEKLGTGAYMSALRRTQVGRFDINDSMAITDVETSKSLTYMLKSAKIYNDDR